MLQQPHTPLVARQPLPARDELLPFRRPIAERLPQPKDMTDDLRPHAALRSEGGNGEDGHEDAADGRGRRVGGGA